MAMQNSIKQPGDAPALQITKPAKKAGFVLEDINDEPTRLAECYVYGVDGLLMAFDAETVSPSARAELVASAARDSGALYQGARVSVPISGGGYQMQLPGCYEAGFSVGDTVSMQATRGIVLIHQSADGSRLADDVITNAEPLVN